MPIDARIALAGRPVEIDNPLDNAGKALTLRALMDRQQSQQSLRDAFSGMDAQGNGVDLGAVYRADPHTGMGMENAMGMRDYRSQMAGARAADVASKAQMRAAKAAKDVVANSLLNYFDAAQATYRKTVAAGADPQTAEAQAHQAGTQAANQFYLQNVAEQHTNGSLPSNFPMPKAFDYTAFAKADDQPLEVYAQHGQGPAMTDDQGQAAAGTPIQPQPGQDGSEPDPEAQGQQGGAPQAPTVPDAEPQPQVEADPGFVQTGSKVQAPALPRSPLASPGAPMQFDQMPDRPQGTGGLPVNFAKNYKFTQLVSGNKANPYTAKVINDWRDGSIIDNDPLTKAQMRVAKAGASNINVSNNSGTIGPKTLGQKAANDIGDGMVKNVQLLASLNSIQQSFKPEYLEIPTQLGMKWDELKNKFGALDTGGKAKLADYAEFQQNGWYYANQVIKFLDGSAVTGNEFERTKRQLPNPGTGVGDGDSPDVFKRKLDNVQRITKLMQANLMYLSKNGLPMDADHMNLDNVPGLMHKRETELIADTKKKFPKMTDAEVRNKIKPQFAQEFGFQ